MSNRIELQNMENNYKGEGNVMWLQPEMVAKYKI